MSASYRLVLGDQILPLDLRTVAVDDQGNLVSMDSGMPLGFHFLYRDWMVFGRIVDGEGAALELSATIGPLPFTAEAPEARGSLRAIIDAANSHLGPSLAVTEDGHIVMRRSCALGSPLTAVQFITAATRLLIPVTPYLDCFAVFLKPPGESGASAGKPLWSRRSPARPTA